MKRELSPRNGKYVSQGQGVALSAQASGVAVVLVALVVCVRTHREAEGPLEAIGQVFDGKGKGSDSYDDHPNCL